MCLIHCDVAVGFEEHHSERPSRLHVSDDVFRKDVQPQVYIGCGVNDSNGDCPDNRDQESDNKSPPREMRWPGADSGETQTYHDEEEKPVPPVRDRLILPHHLGMIIIQRSTNRTRCDPDFFAVKQNGMEDHGRYGRKR